MSVFEHLPVDHAALLRDIVSRSDGALASALDRTDDPSEEQRRAVHDAVADELATEFRGPDWEPTARGLEIESMIDSFVRRFPVPRQPLT